MKPFTIGKKVSVGFASLIAIMAILGGLAVFNMHKVQDGATQLSQEFIPEARIGAAFNAAIAEVQLAVRSYGLTADPHYRDEIATLLAKAHGELDAAHTLANEHPSLVKLRAHLSEVDETLKAYEESVATTTEKNQEIVQSREKLDAAAVAFVANISKLTQIQNERLEKEIKAFAAVEKLNERHEKILHVTAIGEAGSQARIAVFKAQALRQSDLIDVGVKTFEEMDRSFTELLALLKVPSDIEEVNNAKVAAHNYRDNMKRLHDDMTALDKIARQRLTYATKLSALATDSAEAGMARAVESSTDSISLLSMAINTLLVGVGLALLIAIGLAVYIVRTTTLSINKVTLALQAGSEQIVSAAGQVTASSTSLAEGASEQAASLEETSASIEEMTKRNAQGAFEAKALANETRTVADGGAASMARMSKAMEEMKTSNNEISKIIKTIDEIAFQTNILALNAAVEAARAGEAGAGFAVVAEEVRSLAQRCSLASRETAQKIEHALSKSEEGVVISGEVATTLGGIIECVRKVDELISGIAQASNEQSEGIGQINTAVTQMDKVTQSNAAAAEESAAAANQLNGQANELHNLIEDLKALTGAGGSLPVVATAVTRENRRPLVTRNSPVHSTFHRQAMPVGGDDLKFE